LHGRPLFTGVDRERPLLGQAGEAGDEVGPVGVRVIALEARTRHLDEELVALEKQVGAAEAALTAAKKALAQSEVDAMAAELQAMSAKIVTALTEAARLVAEHERVGIAMREVAEKHALPTPPKCRWLLPRELVKSSGAELLRARLDVRHALGGIKEASARPV
jgi:multidrug efflux pump subunit AcrA (membrane-fusion protein)